MPKKTVILLALAALMVFNETQATTPIDTNKKFQKDKESIPLKSYDFGCKYDSNKHYIFLDIIAIDDENENDVIILPSLLEVYIKGLEKVVEMYKYNHSNALPKEITDVMSIAISENKNLLKELVKEIQYIKEVKKIRYQEMTPQEALKTMAILEILNEIPLPAYIQAKKEKTHNNLIWQNFCHKVILLGLEKNNDIGDENLNSNNLKINDFLSNVTNANSAYDYSKSNATERLSKKANKNSIEFMEEYEQIRQAKHPMYKASKLK